MAAGIHAIVTVVVTPQPFLKRLVVMHICTRAGKFALELVRMN